MNELHKKQKEVKRIIKEDYSIIVSNKWFYRYIWLYAKRTPIVQITMSEAIDEILENPDRLAYFIYGQRAEYVDSRVNKVSSRYRD